MSNYRKTIIVTCGAVAAAALGAPLGGGPCWCEMPDAGSLPPGAQPPTGSGPLTCVNGCLGGTGPSAGPSAGPVDDDFEDMFLICICDPEAFQATISFSDEGDFNTQLWLFRPAGNSAVGVIGNDDVSGEDQSSILIPVPKDGSPALTEPGNYYLAITGFDNDPVSKGGFIFDQAASDEVSGPDGPGGDMPIVGWSPGKGDVGAYTIVLSGVTYPGECFCAEDTNGDFVVDVDDLVNVILCWGPASDGSTPCGKADINQDGEVDVDDLVLIIFAFDKMCAGPPCPEES